MAEGNVIPNGDPNSMWTVNNTCKICGAQTPDHETHERWHRERDEDWRMIGLERSKGMQT